MANVTVIAPVKSESVIHKLRCAAYCRVSSSSEDQLHSYAAQVKFYSEKFIGSETEELTDIYADEGISGTGTEKRTEFQRLIRDCKRGKIDRIYTKSISRFARNTKDCLNTVRLLRELGITIFFEKENIDTAKTNDELLITVMGGLAQEESTSISQNMRWSVRKRMENGTYEPSSVPFGYVKKEGRLAIDPPKAEIVRMIYQLYLSGNGLLKIANILNERNIPTITNCPKWQIYPIKYILKNEKYVGDMLLQKYYNTEIVPFKKLKNNGERDQYLIRDSHEPIISRNDFERVQYIMNVKGRIYYNSIRSKSVFSSIIKCGKCGTSFKRKCDNGKYYWVCRNHDENSQDCDVKQIPEETIRKSFIYMFNKLMIHYREILLPLRRSLHELNSRRFNGNIKMLDIRKNIADIKEQRHVISRLRKRGFIDEKKYNEKLSELESQLARQERELKNVSKADTENDTLEQLDTLIDCIEIRQAILTEFDEELFTMIVKKIIVKDNVLEFGLISDIKLKENI